MADVFISYAREDEKEAQLLASRLEATGLNVWWDRSIIVGETFDAAIERELKAAKSVVVLWSHNSIDSNWVRSEAAKAEKRNVLMPAFIEKVEELPVGFNLKQSADLTGWEGEPSHPGFQALLKGIKKAMVQGAPPLPSDPQILFPLLQSAAAGSDEVLLRRALYAFFSLPDGNRTGRVEDVLGAILTAVQKAAPPQQIYETAAQTILAGLE
jgi:hypothetical protein